MLGRDFPSTSCGKGSLYRKTDFFQLHWLYELDCFSTRGILFDIRKKLASFASFSLYLIFYQDRLSIVSNHLLLEGVGGRSR